MQRSITAKQAFGHILPFAMFFSPFLVLYLFPDSAFLKVLFRPTHMFIGFPVLYLLGKWIARPLVRDEPSENSGRERNRF